MAIVNEKLFEALKSAGVPDNLAAEVSIDNTQLLYREIRDLRDLQNQQFGAIISQLNELVMDTKNHAKVTSIHGGILETVTSTLNEIVKNQTTHSELLTKLLKNDNTDT